MKRTMISIALLLTVPAVDAQDRPDVPPRRLPTVPVRPPDVPQGHGRYLVILHDPSTFPHPANEPRPPQAPEPDFARFGGTVEHTERNVRVVMMPATALKQLERHASVKGVQRVWMGEPASELNQESESRLVPASDTAENTLPNGRMYWQSGDFTYDGSGNIRQIGTDSYQYDSGGRLIRSVVNNVVETYEYDAFANLTRKTTAGRPDRIVAVNKETNRLSGYPYDGSGNLLAYDGAEYLYDGFNMMALSVHGGLRRRYIYSPDDERIGTTILGQGVTRWKMRDFQGRVLREFSDVSGFWAWDEDFVYAGNRLISADRTSWNGGKVHFHSDHLGTTRLMTTQSGLRVARHDFFPFGNEQTFLGQEVTNYEYDRVATMKFTGHERDFHGALSVDNSDYLDYMHARYYNPNLGRFLSVDPTWESADLSAPQSWNRYSYVRNNPINNTDPDGRVCVPCVAVGGLLGVGYESYRQVRSGQPVDNARLLAALTLGAGGGGVAGRLAPAAYNAALANPGAVSTATTLVGGALTPGPESLTSAVPTSVRLLTPGAGGRMLTEAIGVVSESPAAQRVAMMDEMLRQISARADAPWVAQKVSATGGATAWVGDMHTLVIDSAGNIYKGPNSLVKFGTKDKDLLVEDWSKLVPK